MGFWHRPRIRLKWLSRQATFDSFQWRFRGRPQWKGIIRDFEYPYHFSVQNYQKNHFFDGTISKQRHCIETRGYAPYRERERPGNFPAERANIGFIFAVFGLTVRPHFQLGKNYFYCTFWTTFSQFQVHTIRISLNRISIWGKFKAQFLKKHCQK